MFRHVVVFRWKDEASEEARSRVAAELGRLPGIIGEIRRYEMGADAGVNEGTFDFALVADFDGVDDYLVYRDHPEHRRVIAEFIAPIVAERASVQYEV
ncbi:Dabb family protein [Bailinhaonella thermotolerans]|uniref:Dabb family protein n=1 Tax=Bailinhaonella thermotolerans TaxID=1070861 RepID=A0A3A4AQS8_9ACTN|nr:Dabb family protein [Bailinhaonella thermotolerans]RJL30959.1 Dabb family protein [Bailinhaonella thermotolerans]